MVGVVATKAALSICVNALTDSDEKSETAAVIGTDDHTKLESYLRALNHQLESNSFIFCHALFAYGVL